MTQGNTTHLRRRARTAALQSLFAGDITGDNQGSQSGISLDWLLEEDPLPGRFRDFAKELLDGVLERKAELDLTIQHYAPAWPVAQLPAVDRNILRIALFELRHCRETPNKTAINEAVELAKAFGSDSSARFINGVLGSVMTDLEMGELAPAGA